MPQVFALAETEAIGLEDLADGLPDLRFDPQDPENCAGFARQLARLGNNRTFLGDIMLEELARRHKDMQAANGYGPQAMILSSPAAANWFIRANIWPSQQEHMLRASGGASFVYDLPHDHNFHFLTLGYFGPGYWSDYYEYDYESVAGLPGEPAGLRFIERSRLEQGKVMLYRAHLDVHRQLPPDALSVSVNVMHTCGAQGWLDQYAFDVGQDRIGRVLSAGSSEAFLRIAVGLGSAEARDLAHRFGHHHPSDRMRLAAFGALAHADTCPQGRDAIWREAELCGSRMVAETARTRRAALVG